MTITWLASNLAFAANSKAVTPNLPTASQFAGFILQPNNQAFSQLTAQAAFYPQVGLAKNQQQLNLAATNPRPILALKPPLIGTSFAAQAINKQQNPLNLLQEQRIKANYWQQAQVGTSQVYAGGQVACVSGCTTADDVTKFGSLLSSSYFIFANYLHPSWISLRKLAPAKYLLHSWQPTQADLTNNPISAFNPNFKITKALLHINFAQAKLGVLIEGEVSQVLGQTQQLNWQGQANLKDFYDQGISLTEQKLGQTARFNLTGRFIGKSAEGLILAYGLNTANYTTQNNLILFKK